ncbi:MAG: polysaccharide biosynthesis tyrosine autokinase [Desulfobacteraceae bacterium]|nr:polysaccharide biosynthesis tyrosine autokinase [Desulfobacteraceae bacterium]
MIEKEIHLRDYLQIAFKRKGSIFTFFVLTLMLVVIATYTATPIYKSSTKVMIEKNTSESFTETYSYASYDPEFLQTQYQLIRSTAVAEKVVENIGAKKLYTSMFEEEKGNTSIINSIQQWFYNIYIQFKEMIGIDKLLSSEEEEKDVIKQNIPSENTEEIDRTQILADTIAGGISVNPVANSRIITISYYSPNPALAMKIVNSVAQAYIDELLDMQMQISEYSIGWMRKKAEGQRTKLEDSEKNLHEYKRKHDIVTVEDRLTILPERLSELSLKLTRAETERKEMAAVYNQVKNVKKEYLETLPVIVDNASVDSINRQIMRSEQKMSDLSKKYGPKHPRMISANNELKGLKEKKYKELEKAVQTIKNEYELAKSNERDLRELLEQTKFKAARLGEKSIQLSILTRNVDTNRYLYDALIKTLKEKGLSEKSQSVNVWVIQKGRLPMSPTEPRKKRNILLGIILGLLGGIGVAFFFEYLDNTVKMPEDIEDRFNIPVIGTIDTFKKKKISIVESILNDPTSITAESFKGLRTSIFLGSADNPPKIMLVTSISPGEGKSSVCACLAAAISDADKKVLLIDGDMRRPVQHQNFSIENHEGLSSLLAGVSQDSHAIVKPYSDHLDVITSGPIPPNPSELLSSPRLQGLVLQFAAEYDMILIDTPPLSSVTDTILYSKNVDGIIIVAWTGKTTHDMLKVGVKQLNEVSAPITGFVLNRFSAKKSGYYYNYGDYYYASDK